MPPLNKIKFLVPKELARYVGKNVPQEAKMMAARGTLPIPPKDLCIVLFFLAHSSDTEIKGAAENSLLSLPVPVIKTLVETATTHPLIIDYYARHVDPDSGLLEDIALNKVTHDETIAFLASKPNKRLVDIIANNQTRLLRYPHIVDELGNNPMVGQATIERILHFIQLETGIKKKEEEPPPPPPEEEKDQEEEMAEEEPEEYEEDEEEDEEDEEDEEEYEEELPDYMKDDDYPWLDDEEDEVMDHWAIGDMPDELMEDFDQDLDEEAHNNLTQQIAGMGISEKIKLAMLGNKEARSILVKDANKIVATAVLSSPKLTDNEIEGISRSRSVSEDIIRQIANNPEWTRNYSVKLNLVNNTKTPIQTAMRYLNFLSKRDVQMVSRSKNVASPVATAAKKLIKKRMERKQ